MTIKRLVFSASLMMIPATMMTPSLKKRMISYQCTKRIDANTTESAEKFLLTRESFVRFEQDSIANSVYRQKRKTGKKRIGKYTVI